MSMVSAVVAGSLLSGLSFTPAPLAAAGVNGPALEGAETPPPIEVDGSQTFPFGVCQEVCVSGVI